MTPRKTPISEGTGEQFECIDCRQTVVMAAGVRGNMPKLCAACISIPGWNTVPMLRERIDPQHHAVWYDYPPEPGSLRDKARG